MPKLTATVKDKLVSKPRGRKVNEATAKFVKLETANFRAGPILIEGYVGTLKKDDRKPGEVSYAMVQALVKACGITKSVKDTDGNTTTIADMGKVKLETFEGKKATLTRK